MLYKKVTLSFSLKCEFRSGFTNIRGNFFEIADKNSNGPPSELVLVLPERKSLRTKG